MDRKVHLLSLQYYAESLLIYQGKIKRDLGWGGDSHTQREQSFLEFSNTTKALAVTRVMGDQNFRISISSQDKDS